MWLLIDISSRFCSQKIPQISPVKNPINPVSFTQFKPVHEVGQYVAQPDLSVLTQHRILILAV